MLQQRLEETNGYRSTPPRVEPNTTKKRLDRDAAEKVLETAALLQRAEQDRLSIAAIEALAAERGISAHHVRQALAMHGHAPRVTTRLTRVRLTRTQWYASAAALVIYWLFVVAAPVFLPAVGAVMGILPLLLCFALGYSLRYKRAGAASGVAVMVATCFSIALGAFARNDSIVAALLSPGLFAVLVLWMTTGAAGAALRQWIAVRQYPYEPTTLRVSDLDR